MRESNPYNAALCDAPGSRNVIHLARLVFLIALAPLAANATPQAGAPEISERLQPFGAVCRGAQACPSAMAADGRNWQVATVPDASGEATDQHGMQSRWVSSRIRWPVTSAGISIAPDASATLRLTNPDLAGGEPSRYGRWDNYSITLTVGDRRKAFRVKRPAGQNVLLLGTGPTRFLTRAVTENVGDTLTVRLQYRGAGDVDFGFPLAGARRALGAIGFIDISADETVAEAAVVAEPAAAPSIAVLGASGNRSGQQIYDMFCFACHATGVSEAPLFGSLEQWQPRIDKGMDELVAMSITGFNLMPPQGTCMNCTEEEMRATIQYMIDSSN